MKAENQRTDRKSLRVISGASADWESLAKDCVCFANSHGGRLRIGIEDNTDQPAPQQVVARELLDKVRKRIGELTVNVQVAPQIVIAENGGQFIDLVVARSVGVASTSDGRYFVRVGDNCRPVLGDDILLLINERPSLPWETITSLGIRRAQCDETKVTRFADGIRNSDRVKQPVKEQSPEEILSHYGLAVGRFLTNLGILLVGISSDRARLGTAPIVQVIKYDERGQKVNKLQWDDFELSPIELVDAIWQNVPDFRDSYEIPEGLFRRSIPAYEERVVRELIVNALVHRPYTQRGDIFLNLHPNHLEIVNPGRLPFGVTPRNILHASRRRNDGLARVFHDLGLMEKEGTGIDLMFERLLASGRPVPVITEGTNSVHVAIQRRILKPELIHLLEETDKQYQLSQRERITLGVLALSEGLTAKELEEQLEVTDLDRLAHWLGRLPSLGIVGSVGKTRATRYFVTPQVLRWNPTGSEDDTHSDTAPQTARVGLEDLTRYPNSSTPEINRRIGLEISAKTIKRTIDALVGNDEVIPIGERRWRRYRLSDRKT